VSAIITYIKQVIAELDYEPFYAKTKVNWIESRSSIEYDENGEIYSMRKCPPLYLETECPVNYAQEQYENYLIMAALFGVLFIIHIILLCLLTED
jgi:hypothetical protein